MKIKYFKKFYHYLGVNLFVTILLSILVSFFDSIGIGFFIGLIKFFFDADKTNFNPETNGIAKALSHIGLSITSVWQLLLIGIIAFVIKSILHYKQQIINAKNTTRLVSKQRKDLISGLEYLSYPAFIKQDFGHIQNVSTIEISRFNNALLALLNGSQYLIMAIIYLIISLLINYQISLIILGFGLLFFTTYSPLKKYFNRLSSQFSLANNQYNSLLSQILNNFKYIKSTYTFPLFSKRIIELGI